jgi:hypothetical protein
MSKLSFTAHPRSVGESYGEHLRMALGFAATMFVASLACAVHALLPFAFERTGSNAIAALHRRMITHRVGGQPPLPVERSAGWLSGQNLP